MPTHEDVCRDYLSMSSQAESASSEMQEAVEKSETRRTPLGSFPAIFAQALSLGTLSRRRVFREAEQMLEKRTALQQWKGQLKTARSAGITAEAADFHWHIASRDRVRDTRTGTAPRHWRWRVRLSSSQSSSVPQFILSTLSPSVVDIVVTIMLPVVYSRPWQEF